MSPNMAYTKDAAEKEVEKCNDVKYDCDKKGQHYAAVNLQKKLQNHCRVDFSTGSKVPATDASRCSTSEPGSAASCRRSKKGAPKKTAAKRSTPSKVSTRECRPSGDTKAGRKLTPTEVAEKCYEVRRLDNFEPCRTMVWQNGKYCRDDCGSGIVPRRQDIHANKRIWCKTPLSMYQATIGELGKQMLCRETIIQRDIKPGPPCNVCEDVLPLCRGYYRKYDCLRPCEEDRAYVKRGQKYYRTRTERYWEPCLTSEQKHQMNVNEYGPQNAALTLKLRRERWGIPCW